MTAMAVCAGAYAMPSKWTCPHCGRKLTSQGGHYYHLMRRKETGECPPTQEASRRVRRKMGRPKKEPKDPITKRDKAWIDENWT